MSQVVRSLKQIEELDVNQLANALEFNGYAECVGAIRSKSIDGEQFLKLTEVQISLWRLPSTQTRRLWSFLQQVKQDPTQFITQVNTKMTPKVNTLGKPPSSTGLPNKFNISTDKPIEHKGKPNISMKPNSFCNLKKSEAKFSTLTKQESKLLKDKLAQVYKKDSEDIPNNSFLHNQKQPALPPKPNHLKAEIKPDINQQIEDSSDDNDDGYLQPIKRELKQHDHASENVSTPLPVSTSNSISRTNSLLSKLRKNYTHLEIRPRVVENDYDERNNKSKAKDHRPLPPVPINTNQIKRNIDIEMIDDDEQLSEYAPVLDDDENFGINMASLNQSVNNTAQLFRIKQKALYKSDTAVQSEEQLPEYTTIIDDDDKFCSINKNKKTKSVSEQQSVTPKRSTSFKRPLPPIPVLSANGTSQLLIAEQKYKLDSAVENNNDDEQLPEYTPILEDEGAINEHIKTEEKLSFAQKEISSFRLPSPITNDINCSIRNKQRLPIPIPFSDEEDSTSTVQKLNNNLKPESTNKSATSGKLLKPRAELPKSPVTLAKPSNNFPKPPSNLPKPPSDLPSPPPFLLESQRDLATIELAALPIEPQRRPLPPLPPIEPDEPTENFQSEVPEKNAPYYSQVDITTEPCYRETDRKGARLLLAGLPDGAFVIRPSRLENYICTLSITHKTKMFNLGVEKDASGILHFGSVTPDFNQPIFYGIGEIISYYSRHPLHLSGESIILKDILPYRRR